MDTVNWSEERFEEIKSKLGLFLKQAGYKESDITFIPCSGLNGENLATKANKLIHWYNGPCLMDVIGMCYLKNVSLLIKNKFENNYLKIYIFF